METLNPKPCFLRHTPFFWETLFRLLGSRGSSATSLITVSLELKSPAHEVQVVLQVDRAALGFRV